MYSSLFAAFALAGALGPLIMGAGYDRTGSYTGPLLGFFLAILLATVLMTRLGPYRFCPSQPSESQPILPVTVAEDSLGACPMSCEMPGNERGSGL